MTKLTHTIEELEDGTTIYWYSYHFLREHLTEMEINRMRQDRATQYTPKTSVVVPTPDLAA